MGEVELMRELQGERSGIAFAREIGISYSMYVKIMGGRRSGGRRVMRALVDRFPERREDILRVFLAANGHASDTVGTVEVTA